MDREKLEVELGVAGTESNKTGRGRSQDGGGQTGRKILNQRGFKQPQVDMTS